MKIDTDKMVEDARLRRDESVRKARERYDSDLTAISSLIDAYKQLNGIATGKSEATLIATIKLPKNKTNPQSTRSTDPHVPKRRVNQSKFVIAADQAIMSMMGHGPFMVRDVLRKIDVRVQKIRKRPEQGVYLQLQDHVKSGAVRKIDKGHYEVIGGES